MEMRPSFKASTRLVPWEIARSRIGLPYFGSPICRKGVSMVASMALPAVEGHLAFFDLDPVHFVDLADGAADELGRLEQAGHRQKRLDHTGFRIFQPLGQQGQDGLARREIAGGRKRDNALAGLLEQMQLAEDRDVVDAGIGARVGDHDETIPHEDADTIRHGGSSRGLLVELLRCRGHSHACA
jgi:hypothetical protein